jgi:hypothetical protein
MKEFIGIHDKYRFEIKLNLDDRSSYKFEYYFFIPESLNISYYTYDKSKFYSSLHQYIRYQTPDVDFYLLFDTTNIISPINRIVTYLDKLKNSTDRFVEERLIDEMKLFGCIVREKIRETNPANLLSLFSSVDESIEKINRIICSYNYNKKIVDAFRYIDEYINIIKIERLTELAKDLNLDETLKRKFEDYINRCFKYIDFNGYKKILPDEIDYFLYHRSLLKKFVSSCLFLRVQMAFDFYHHLISSIASALAMLFAILVTIYAQKKYPLESALFIVIIVISYVFKDRIKEFSKVFFSKLVGDYIYDRKLKIYEPVHHIKIGYIKESFSILSKDSVGSDIIRVRNIDNFDVIDEDAKFEVVLRYKKIIYLNRNIIDKCHTRRRNLVSILRFSIEDFLKHTDDAQIDYNLFYSGKKYTFAGKRNYHLNLVLKSLGRDGKMVYKRYRIIFNRDGILKVENILVDGGDV